MVQPDLAELVDQNGRAFQARLLKAGKQVFCSIPDCHVRELLTNMIEHLTEPHEHDGDTITEPGENT